MTQRLNGLTVIDTDSFLAAPADIGAHVIMIESVRGDGYRTQVGGYPGRQLTFRGPRIIALGPH